MWLSTASTRDNRETDHDPRNVFCAEKIILNRALRPAEERAEDGNSHQIEQQDWVIDRRKSRHKCRPRSSVKRVAPQKWRAISDIIRSMVKPMTKVSRARHQCWRIA